MHSSASRHRARTRFQIRRIKYIRKARRSQRVHSFNAWQGAPGVKHPNGNFPYIFVGDGTKQLPPELRADFPLGPHFPMILDLVHTAYPSGGGYRRPYSVAYLPPYAEPKPHHTNSQDHFALIFFRRIKYRGKKIGRQNGADRKAWGAYRFWRKFGVWPAWDTQARY